MNYKLIEFRAKINFLNCFYDLLNENLLAYYDENFIFQIYNEKTLKLLFKMEMGEQFKLTGVPYFYSKGQLLFVNKNKIIQLTLDKFYLEEIFSANCTNLGILGDNIYVLQTILEKENFLIKKQLLEYYDTKKKKIFYRSDGKIIPSIFYYSNDLILLTNNKLNKVSRWDSELNQIIWEYTFDGELVGPFNVKPHRHKNILVLKHSKTFITGLDTTTGKELWKHGPIYPHFVQKGKMLYGLNTFYFNKVNIETGELEVMNVNKLMKEEKLSPIKNAIAEGKIFFSDMIGGKFGIFDISSMEIDWKFDLTKNMKKLGYKANLDAPIIHKNRIYIRDHEGTLWIFEKEY